MKTVNKITSDYARERMVYEVKVTRLAETAILEGWVLEEKIKSLRVALDEISSVPLMTVDEYLERLASVDTEFARRARGTTYNDKETGRLYHFKSNEDDVLMLTEVSSGIPCDDADLVAKVFAHLIHKELSREEKGYSEYKETTADMMAEYSRIQKDKVKEELINE